MPSTGAFMFRFALQTRTCRGEAPPSCCRKTVRSLKSPTGAFIAALRSQTRTCRGEAPPSCCRKTVRSLKSPTGAFIAALRSQTRSYHSGNSISSFIFTNPYFSYNGRPISVASNEIAVIPLLLVSLISISNVL